MGVVICGAEEEKTGSEGADWKKVGPLVGAQHHPNEQNHVLSSPEYC